MNILGFLNRATNFLGTVLPYGFAFCAVMIAYGWLSQEEYDEDYVTFTVSCQSVLHDAEHYPAHIVNHCAESRNEIK
jgi:hypothetical protein